MGEPAVGKVVENHGVEHLDARERERAAGAVGGPRRKIDHAAARIDAHRVELRVVAEDQGRGGPVAEVKRVDLPQIDG